VNVEKYDEPLVLAPTTSLFVTFGTMFLGKKLDWFNPTVVKFARYIFIGYLAAMQLFVLYVRKTAKSVNDRTPLTMKNPLSDLLKNQVDQRTQGNDMVKNLANSFLSSQSTVMEYDLKMAQNLQGGLLFNMAFMWFLHFTMKQVQPLIVQSATGILNLVYNPLFQVYVLKRNLERPFPNAKKQKIAEAASTAAASAATGENATEDDNDVVVVVDDEESIKIAANEEEGESSDETSAEDEEEEEEESITVDEEDADDAEEEEGDEKVEVEAEEEVDEEEEEEVDDEMEEEKETTTK